MAMHCDALVYFPTVWATDRKGDGENDGKYRWNAAAKFFVRNERRVLSETVKCI